MTKRKADRVARTLKVLRGCILQQQASMRSASALRRPTSSADSSARLGRGRGVGSTGAGGRGGTAWGAGDGWEGDGAGAHETRLRLLTLQGEWLEAEGVVVAEQQQEVGIGRGAVWKGRGGRRGVHPVLVLRF